MGRGEPLGAPRATRSSSKTAVALTGLLVAGTATALVAADTNEVRFEVGPIPARRSVSAYSMSVLFLAETRDGVTRRVPSLSWAVRDTRRDERTGTSPLTFEVIYDQQRRVVQKSDLPTDAALPASPVEKRRYRVIFEPGRQVPTMGAFAPPRERRHVRADYARYGLIREAAMQVRGTTARIAERAPAVERLVAAFLRQNPAAREERIRLSEVEARLQGTVVHDGQRCARFGYQLVGYLRLGAQTELRQHTGGTITLRLRDGLPVHVRLRYVVESETRNKAGALVRIEGSGEGEAYYRYGDEVPPLGN